MEGFLFFHLRIYRLEHSGGRGGLHELEGRSVRTPPHSRRLGCIKMRDERTGHSKLILTQKKVLFIQEVDGLFIQEVDIHGESVDGKATDQSGDHQRQAGLLGDGALQLGQFVASTIPQTDAGLGMQEGGSNDVVEPGHGPPFHLMVFHHPDEQVFDVGQIFGPSEGGFGQALDVGASVLRTGLGFWDTSKEPRTQPHLPRAAAADVVFEFGDHSAFSSEFFLCGSHTVASALDDGFDELSEKGDDVLEEALFGRRGHN